VSSIVSPSSTRAPSPLATILTAGCVAAALDLLFAFVFYGIRNGIPPQRILQTIGSGLFGTDSFQMGWQSAAVGFVCHFTILIVAAALYFYAAGRMRWMNRQALICGLAFGVAVYVVMNFVVVPLSAAPKFQRSLVPFIGEMCSHLFFVGVPIAYLTRRYWNSRG
jgi:uncharacterized membrane protein YagU involved in acid resistance